MAVDPKTGEALPLDDDLISKLKTVVTPGVAEAPEVPKTSQKEKVPKTERIGSGEAIVLGFTQGGFPIHRIFKVDKEGAAAGGQGDPYALASRFASEVVDGGGKAAVIWRRSAYYVDYRPDTDFFGFAFKRPYLRVCPDIPGPPGVGVNYGERGQKGICVVDASTWIEMTPGQIQEWFQASKPHVQHIRRTMPKLKTGKKEMARALEISQAMQAVVKLYTEMGWRGFNAAKCLDTYPEEWIEEERKGVKFTVVWQGGDMVSADGKSVPAEFWVEPNDIEAKEGETTEQTYNRACSEAACKLALEMSYGSEDHGLDGGRPKLGMVVDLRPGETGKTICKGGAGRTNVARVEWQGPMLDNAGKVKNDKEGKPRTTTHMVTRGFALRHMPSDEHDKDIKEFRAGYQGDILIDENGRKFRRDDTEVQEGYAEDLVALLNPWDGRHKVARGERWEDAHQEYLDAVQELEIAEKTQTLAESDEAERAQQEHLRKLERKVEAYKRVKGQVVRADTREPKHNVTMNQPSTRMGWAMQKQNQPEEGGMKVRKVRNEDRYEEVWRGPTREGRNRNGKHGQTWDRMKRAQDKF